jgi:hypothetical protein
MGGDEVAGILDDDTHTIKDGAHARLLRMRKWLVLSGAALVLLHSGFLNYEALTRALFVPGLSRDFVHFGFSLTALYQLLMMIAVAVQFYYSYAESLRDRLGIPETDAPRLLAVRMSRLEEQVAKYGKASEIGQRASAELLKISSAFERANRRHSQLGRAEIATDILRMAPASIFFLYAVVFHSHFWPIPSFAPEGPPQEPAAATQPEKPPG